MNADGEKPTLDSAVDAAWDKLANGVDTPSEGETPTAEAEGLPDLGAQAKEEPAQGKGGPESATPPPIQGDASRTRDQRGRFRPTAVQSTTKQPARGAQQSSTAPQAATAQEQRDLRPPPSLSPQAREAWGQVPKEVQAEIWRREREITQDLRESAGLKEHAQWFTQTFGPYEQIFRAEGVDIRTGLGNMAQALAVLHGPSPYAKAQLWTTVAKQYGIDPELLNQAWNGTLQPNQAQQTQTIDPRMIAQQAAQYAEERLEGRRQAQVLESAYREVDQHSETREFFDELRPAMSALMDSFANVKQHLDIPEAYELALSRRPDLQAILAQRERANAASRPAPNVVRAKAAGSSIRGIPAPPAPPAPRKPGIDGAVDAAWDSLVRRSEIL